MNNQWAVDGNAQPIDYAMLLKTHETKQSHPYHYYSNLLKEYGIKKLYNYKKAIYEQKEGIFNCRSAGYVDQHSCARGNE